MNDRDKAMDKAIYKSEYMSSLIRYIENNLISDLDIERLTNAGYVSHTQLYRDFYSLTGHPVKEYIRRRRLSNALALLRHLTFRLRRLLISVDILLSRHFAVR